MNPDKFAYHEALDRLTMIQDQLENALANHPVTNTHPSVFAGLVASQKVMNDLRSEICAVTFRAYPEKTK